MARRRAARPRALGDKRDLAGGVAVPDHAVRGRGLGQREGLADDNPQLPFPGEPGQVQPGALPDLGAWIGARRAAEHLDARLQPLADRARVATIVAFGKGLQAGIKVLGGAPGADPGTQIRERARLELARLAGERKLRVIVSQTFPLAEAAAAHRSIAGGHTTGKIALIP